MIKERFSDLVRIPILFLGSLCICFLPFSYTEGKPVFPIAKVLKENRDGKAKIGYRAGESIRVSRFLPSQFCEFSLPEESVLIPGQGQSPPTRIYSRIPEEFLIVYRVYSEKMDLNMVEREWGTKGKQMGPGYWIFRREKIHSGNKLIQFFLFAENHRETFWITLRSDQKRMIDALESGGLFSACLGDLSIKTGIPGPIAQLVRAADS